MKSLFIGLFISLFVFTSQAEMPSYSCGIGSIEKIATYDPTRFSVRQLNEDETAEIEKMIDFKFECNEGVEILKTFKKVNQVFLSAICSVDSLGTKTVALPLVCEETYLN